MAWRVLPERADVVIDVEMWKVVCVCAGEPNCVGVSDCQNKQCMHAEAPTIAFGVLVHRTWMQWCHEHRMSISDEGWYEEGTRVIQKGHRAADARVSTMLWCVPWYLRFYVQRHCTATQQDRRMTAAFGVSMTSELCVVQLNQRSTVFFAEYSLHL